MSSLKRVFAAAALGGALVFGTGCDHLSAEPERTSTQTVDNLAKADAWRSARTMLRTIYVLKQDHVSNPTASSLLSRLLESISSQYGTNAGKPLQITFKTTEQEVLNKLEAEILAAYQFAPQGTSINDIQTRALNEMIHTLDPHSLYLSPDMFSELIAEMTGHYVGIGTHISKDPETGAVTIEPFENSPADKAGLQAGDIVTHVDGVSAKETALSELVSIIKGEAGKTVLITIERDGQVLNVSVVRGEIEAPSPVVSHVMQNDIGYIGLAQFTGNSYEHFEKAVQELNGKVKSYIIDLRMNPGGALDQVKKISELFLNKGDTIYSVRDGRGNVQVGTDPDGDYTNGKPVVVLLNEGSASASEIFGGAIQDNDRGIVLGRQSFGKGSVQQLMPMRADGGALKVTIKLYYTPSGDTVQGKGITPNIEYLPAEGEAFYERSEASLEATLQNPNEIQDDVETAATCKGVEGATFDQVDEDFIRHMRDGTPWIDFQLACAADYLQKQSNITVTTPINKSAPKP
jgi:C-terminal peptidase prc